MWHLSLARGRPGWSRARQGAPTPRPLMAKNGATEGGLLAASKASGWTIQGRAQSVTPGASVPPRQHVRGQRIGAPTRGAHTAPAALSPKDVHQGPAGSAGSGPPGVSVGVGGPSLTAHTANLAELPTSGSRAGQLCPPSDGHRPGRAAPPASVPTFPPHPPPHQVTVTASSQEGSPRPAARPPEPRARRLRSLRALALSEGPACPARPWHLEPLEAAPAGEGVSLSLQLRLLAPRVGSDSEVPRPRAESRPSLVAPPPGAGPGQGGRTH